MRLKFNVVTDDPRLAVYFDVFGEGSTRRGDAAADSHEARFARGRCMTREVRGRE